MARPTISAVKECLRNRRAILISQHVKNQEKPDHIIKAKKDIKEMYDSIHKLQTLVYEWENQQRDRKIQIEYQIDLKIKELQETILLEGDSSGMLQLLQSLDNWQPNL